MSPGEIVAVVIIGVFCVWWFGTLFLLAIFGSFPLGWHRYSRSGIIHYLVDWWRQR